jgi:cell division septal protein FtsQ
MRKYLPLKKAFLSIFYSIIIVLAIGSVTLFMYLKVLENRKVDASYNIDVIVQTGPKKEALSSAYLAELMNLAGDEKTNLYKFNTAKARKALIASPLIKKASVKKIFPNTVFVDYTARLPMALLYDYPNTAIDDEGYVFPISPFFTPKKLPEIYLGLMPFGFKDDEFGAKGASWNEPVKGDEVRLAYSIIALFNMITDVELLRVDVSNAFSDSWGRREVVLVINDRELYMQDDKLVTLVFPRILRLSTQNYEEDLKKYSLIKDTLKVSSIEKVDLKNAKNIVKLPGLIVDLRIQDLAYVR